MAAPLYDDTARTYDQAQLAHAIRRSCQIAPLGPNSKAVHDQGGSVHLTPAEAEDAARGVIESDWLRSRLADAWDEGYQRAGDETIMAYAPDGPTDSANPYRARAASA